MIKTDRPCLYLWRSNSWCYAQVVDKQTCSVLAAARTRLYERAQLPKLIAARCLVAGVFELQYKNKYVGKTIKTITSLKALGITI